MANTDTPLLQELSRAIDSHDIRDQLLVLFQREVAEDSEKMQDYRRLSCELREGVRMKDGYINELQMSDNSDEVLESIEIMRRMQLDDMEKASHLLLMAREVQNKLHEKNTFIVKPRGQRVATGSLADKVGDPVSHADLQFRAEVINIFQSHVGLYGITLQRGLRALRYEPVVVIEGRSRMCANEKWRALRCALERARA
ncbi:hypothetical protein Tco_1253451 [Tanacetum coccineum]